MQNARLRFILLCVKYNFFFRFAVESTLTMIANEAEGGKDESTFNRFEFISNHLLFYISWAQD